MKLTLTCLVAAVVVAAVGAPSGALAGISSPPVWEAAKNLPAQCKTKAGMSRGDCTALNMFWLNQDTCVNALNVGLPNTFDLRRNLPPFASWVSGSCPTPCAVKAKDKGVNPRTYCKSQNMPVNYNDGGCKTRCVRAELPHATGLREASMDGWKLTPCKGLRLDPLPRHVQPPAVVLLEGRRHVGRLLELRRDRVHVLHPLQPVLWQRRGHLAWGPWARPVLRRPAHVLGVRLFEPPQGPPMRRQRVMSLSPRVRYSWLRVSWN